MHSLLLFSLLGALFFCCLLFPSVRESITGDELLDAHEAGLALVAFRTPFRETGPPACMAKLIMLRHKINQDNTKRRSSRVRQASRTFHISPHRPTRDLSWMRVGRPYSKQNY